MREALRVLLKMASQENKEVYIVGGFVRDSLRGLASRDVDMVVSEEAEQFAKRAAWRLRGEYEMLDSHSQYSRVALTASDGKPFTLDISLLQGRGIEDDLSRRDFTVNAMAVRLSDYVKKEDDTWQVIDPCGGQEDLRQQILRLTSERCLADDPVRLFRAARFALKLGFSLASETKTLLLKNANLAGNAQKMKLTLELFQLLAQPYAAEGLRMYQDFGVLAPIFPPFYRMSMMKDHEETLISHGLRTCRQLEEILQGQNQLPAKLQNELLLHLLKPLCEKRPKIAYLRLACLLHDVGKVDSQPCGTSLLASFNHEIAGEAYIVALAKRLCLCEEEENYLVRLVCNHSRPQFLPNDVPGSRLRFFRQFGEMAPELILLSMANTATRCGVPETEGMAHVLSLYFQGEYASLPQPLISAQEIMTFFNLPPVRTVGGLLEEVYAAQLDGTVSSKSDALAYISQLLHARGMC